MSMIFNKKNLDRIPDGSISLSRTEYTFDFPKTSMFSSRLQNPSGVPVAPHVVTDEKMVFFFFKTFWCYYYFCLIASKITSTVLTTIALYIVRLKSRCVDLTKQIFRLQVNRRETEINKKHEMMTNRKPTVVKKKRSIRPDRPVRSPLPFLSSTSARSSHDPTHKIGQNKFLKEKH